MTPTVTSQHSNTTASHNDTTAATTNAESLRLLSSQLQQLPQPQLTNLLLQAISGGTQIPQPQVTIASTTPPALHAQLVIPTSGTTVNPTSQPAAGSNSSPQSSVNNQELLHQQQLTNMLIRTISSGTQLTQSHVTIPSPAPPVAHSQITIPTSVTIPTPGTTYNLNLPISEQEDRLSEASDHVPPIQLSLGSLNQQVEPHTQEPAVLGTTHPPPLIPPVPARLRTRILAGEYIDFNSHAIFSMRDPPNAQQHMQTFTLQLSSQSGELHLAPTPTHSKKINSFALWMVAWNLHVSTILSAKPSQVLEMFGYQRIITSLNLHLPLAAWMTYDIKFRTLAASYPMLCWDVRHLDTWVECLSIPKSQPECWPCPHCGSMYHFPDRCPFHPGTSSAPLDGELTLFQNPGTVPTTPWTVNPTYSQPVNPTSSQPQSLFPPPSLARFCHYFNN